MIPISADIKFYNANSNDNYVGDCVKRSLSYAYGVDYDEIARQLNRTKREVGAPQFNSRKTFTRFLKDNGAIPIPLVKGETYRISEEEFSKKYPDKVYILLTGPKNKNYSTHMVCIFKGDIIDSWDSSEYVVYNAWEIPNVSLETSDVQWNDVKDELYAYIDDYLRSSNDKYGDWFTCERVTEYKVDPTTYKVEFHVTTGDLPDDSQYYGNTTYVKRIVVKLNPRLTIEQNIKSLQPKLKQKVYNYIYQFQKDKRDTLEARTIELHPNSDYIRRSDLLKLPAWCRKYVLRFYDWGEDYYEWRYEVELERLPEDPEQTGKRTITFYADYLNHLKEQLEDYRQDIS